MSIEIVSLEIDSKKLLRTSACEIEGVSNALKALYGYLMVIRPFIMKFFMD